MHGVSECLLSELFSVTEFCVRFNRVFVIEII